MPVNPADRLTALPPYLFEDIDQKKRAAIAAGRDVIDLGVGDPDRPTPDFVIKRMLEAVPVPSNHRYPHGTGLPEFKRAAADWFAARFGVELDARTEVLTLIGTKEGLGHLPLAVLNPGEVSLIPEPGYPVYNSATLFAGGTAHVMPLRPKHGWTPDLDAVPTDIRRRARLMFLNYPNNPTAATCTLEFFQEAVKFARANDLLIAQDAAYSELYFDERPPSILQVAGAKDCCIEFHSLSKSFNMTGWRLGFAVGNPIAIAALAKVKNNVDSGQFLAIQWAGVQAISQYDHVSVKAQIDIYRERRDTFIKALIEQGIEVEAPRATFYVWVRGPKGVESMRYATRVLDEANVVVIPGVGFGRAGEGYWRAALTLPSERLREAAERLGHVRF
jgi:LL-diaminopimelate aminotransferase